MVCSVLTRLLEGGWRIFVVKESIPTGTRNVVSFVCWLCTYSTSILIFLPAAEWAWFTYLTEWCPFNCIRDRRLEDLGVNAVVFHNTFIIPSSWFFWLSSFPYLCQKYICSLFQANLIHVYKLLWDLFIVSLLELQCPFSW